MRKVLLSLIVVLIASCSSHEETRMSVATEHMSILSEIESREPGTMMMVNDAPGFAIFSKSEINLVLISTGSGIGTVYNNQTGERTYMDVFETGVGVGLGGTDINYLIVFNDEESMTRFVTEGWTFRSQSDATMIINDDKSVTIDGMRVFEHTEAGVDLHLMLSGIRFSKNPDLN
ncbi:hypothetical protein [Thalassotalea crassostreae]|uniref:hypothetical protein n=1 Tax=Thalassotalea crassostreae TaxID=1763536 RepID=UPI00083807AC|nr:hypothetical protein [Thalassotalea crassostreae]